MTRFVELPSTVDLGGKSRIVLAPAAQPAKKA